MLGVQKMKEMFDLTFKAMDAMDDFRSKSIAVMGQNNAMIKEQRARANTNTNTNTNIDKTRQAQAREATKVALRGPVSL